MTNPMPELIASISNFVNNVNPYFMTKMFISVLTIAFIIVNHKPFYLIIVLNTR